MRFFKYSILLFAIAYAIIRLGVKNMTFPEILKYIRKQLNLTQEQFARELSISFSTLNRWENGHTSPSALAKKQIIKYCIDSNIESSIIQQLE